MKEDVEIGGEPRPVLYCTNAFKEYEEITGFSLLSGGDNGIGSFKGINAMVFVGLKWGLYNGDGVAPKPKFNLLTVGDWLDGIDLNGTDGPVKRMMELFIMAFPKPKNADAAGNAA